MTAIKTTQAYWFNSDNVFNQLYPHTVQPLAARHWTPLKVAQKAASFLDTGNVKILDIGSGAGKFCLAAAYFHPKPFYYGVEQRKPLVYNAETARQVLQLKNVSFLHANFTQLNFRAYDHFYFYNSFYENIAEASQMDDSIDYSAELYGYYSRYLYRQLEQAPAGTRLATYHTLPEEIPASFCLVESFFDNRLDCWIKIE